LNADGTCADARVVLGAVAPTQLVVEDAAKALIGHKLDENTLKALDAAAQAACKPITDKRGTIEYRTKIAGVLARRVAAIAFDRATGKTVKATDHGEVIRFDNHQRRSRRVPVRAAADPARRAARCRRP